MPTVKVRPILPEEAMKSEIEDSSPSEELNDEGIAGFWPRLGLLPNVPTRINNIRTFFAIRYVVDVFLIIGILKSLLSLYFGWNDAFLENSGDFYVAFDSKPIWFYMHVTKRGRADPGALHSGRLSKILETRLVSSDKESL